jgi:L-amino acid N-acyltransferase YncA
VTSEGLLIRDADAADWPAIFPFFTAIVADGRTYAYPEGLSSDAARALWMPGPPSRTVVAVADGVVVGSATMGPNRAGRGAHIATASFMVDPEGQGRGVGRALATDVFAWAEGAGFVGMQFNAVVETNTAAVALWTSFGMRIIGTVPDAFRHPEHGLVGLHVMYRRF